MQVSVESGEGLQRRMTVEVPAEQVQSAVDNQLKSLARTVRVDGFRPGKVPMRVLRQRFGEHAKEEAYGRIVQSTFQEAVMQEQLQLAGEPNIELKAEDDSFGYVAEFEIMPEIELVDLADAEVERDTAEVADSDLDNMLEKLRAQRTTWNTVERAAQDGDRVTVSFVGKVDGEAFEGGSADNVPLVLGSGMMIEGFEKGLEGASSGDERSLELSFPDDYRVESLAGKPVVFVISLKEVQEPILPPLDEDFARALGIDDGSLDALRTEVKGNMEREMRQKLRARNKDHALSLLLDKHQLEVPRALVDGEALRMRQHTQEEMQRAGQGGAMELPVDVFKEDAERRVALGLLVGKLAQTHGLSADESNLRSIAEDFAGGYEDPEEVVNYYLNDQEARASLENLAVEDAIVEWVFNQAKVEEKTFSFDEIM